MIGVGDAGDVGRGAAGGLVAGGVTTGGGVEVEVEGALGAGWLRGGSWTFLTIPPGGSGDYNKNPTMEKGR